MGGGVCRREGDFVASFSGGSLSCASISMEDCGRGIFGDITSGDVELWPVKKMMDMRRIRKRGMVRDVHLLGWEYSSSRYGGLLWFS